ncbi:MAG: restriction endonuclease [Bacteroidia bacterium]
MSAPPVVITKASGDKVPFEVEKLKRSLRNAGASEKAIQHIVIEVKKILVPGISTRKIYNKAFQLLKKAHKPCAARYKLKRALMELGPSGYPFERFIGAVMEARGYNVDVGITINGQCITHEVDVLAENDESRIAMECKYGNSKAKKIPVTTAMYVHSRVRDLWSVWKEKPQFEGKRFRGFIVTNVKFTSDAMNYARCTGELELLSWDYPKKENLRNLLDKYQLFPITVLSSLTIAQKRALLDEGVILCRELLNNLTVLKKLNITEKRVKDTQREIEGLCG